MRRRVLNTIAALAIALVASIGFAAPAKAGYLWDLPDAITAWAVNFCGPVDVPSLSNGQGMDTLLGTNTGRLELVGDLGEGSNIPPSLATYHVNTPSDQEAGGNQPGGIDKLKHAGWEPGKPGDINDTAYWASNPSYIRYGFDTFKWPTYNIACGNIIALALNSIASTVFTISNMVIMWSMFILQVATGDTLYQPLMFILKPFIGLFGTLFKPIAYLAAIFGVVYIWFQSKGSNSKVLQAVLWAASILAITTFITDSPGRFANAANNVVTMVGSTAASEMMRAANFSNAACRVDLQQSNTGNSMDAYTSTLVEGFKNEQLGDGEGFGGFSGAPGAVSTPGSNNCISEALWYGTAYQPWVAGLVGPNAQAQAYYGPAFLNSLYAVNDGQGLRQSEQREKWNAASEAFVADDGGDSSGMLSTFFGSIADTAAETVTAGGYNSRTYNDAGLSKGTTKIHLWAFGTTSAEGNGDKDGDANEGYWRTNNFLGVISQLCGNAFGPNHERVEVDDPSQDARYYYCQPRTSVDAAAYLYLQGTIPHHRLFTALIALVNAIMVANVVALVALYLMFKKVGLYFLLLFSGVILAVATWAGERGRAVGRGYGEVLLSNVVKQCIALVVLLFVVYGFALILAPQNMFGGSSDTIGGQLAGSHLGYLARPFLCLMFIMGMVAFYLPFKKFFTGVVRGDGAEATKNLARLPHRTASTAAKATAITAAVVATGGAAAAAAGVSGAGSAAGIAKGAGLALNNPVGQRAVQLMATRIGGKVGGAGGSMAAMAAFNPDNLGKAGAWLAGKGGDDPTGALYDFKNQQARAAGDPTEWGRGKGQRRMTPAELHGAMADLAGDELLDEKRRHGGTGKDGGLPNAKEAVQRAKDKVDTPGFVDNGVQADVKRSGDTIAKEYGLTPGKVPDAKLAEVLPHIVESEYRGNPGAMDPRNPASAALQAVMYETDSKKQQELMGKATSLVGEHGLPGVVGTVGSNAPMAGWAGGVVSAIPALNASSSQQDRVAAANDLAALQMVTPMDSPINTQIQQYREALLNTGGVTNGQANIMGKDLAQALQPYTRAEAQPQPLPGPQPVPMPEPMFGPPPPPATGGGPDVPPPPAPTPTPPPQGPQGGGGGGSVAQVFPLPQQPVAPVAPAAPVRAYEGASPYDVVGTTPIAMPPQPVQPMAAPMPPAPVAPVAPAAPARAYEGASPYDVVGTTPIAMPPQPAPPAPPAPPVAPGGTGSTYSEVMAVGTYDDDSWPIKPDPTPYRPRYTPPPVPGVPAGGDGVAQQVSHMAARIDALTQQQQAAQAQGAPAAQGIPLPPQGANTLGAGQGSIEALRARYPRGGSAGLAAAVGGAAGAAAAGGKRRRKGKGATNAEEELRPLEVGEDTGDLRYEGAETITGKRARRDGEDEGDAPSGPSFT